jgi:DNA-nicking Smr family endonuclease
MSGDQKDWEDEVIDVKPLNPADRAFDPPTRVKRRRPRAADEFEAFDFDSVKPKHQSAFDPLLFSRIASGKVKIQFSYDLHGYTERAAYDALTDVLGTAYMDGRRYGLIVTGKGRDGNSHIRATLPKWLSSPKFSSIVSSFDYAAKEHGGDGAFYVLLRRQGR